MSMTALRPYLRARFTALKFKEWPDPFGLDNIPANLIDKAFHVGPPSFSGVQRDNIDTELLATIEVRIHLKGFRDPAKALDNALAYGNDIIAEVCKLKNWNATAIKGITLQNAEFIPLEADQNDNVVVGVFVFAARINVCIE